MVQYIGFFHINFLLVNSYQNAKQKSIVWNEELYFILFFLITRIFLIKSSFFVFQGSKVLMAEILPNIEKNVKWKDTATVSLHVFNSWLLFYIIHYTTEYNRNTVNKSECSIFLPILFQELNFRSWLQHCSWASGSTFVKQLLPVLHHRRKSEFTWWRK